MALNKDNVDLICDIGEISGLFERSHSLDDFLSTAVSIIAFHMRAAVCSIYLYDSDRKELILSANQGLESAPRSVRLKYGEGITGLSLKEMRPICEGHGSRNPNFKFIEGIQEESYEAFLAVPILRGINRIGVIVVQDPQPYYFDQHDIKALRAISAQLAVTIENAKLLIDLHGGDDEAQEEEEELPVDIPSFIKGKSASEGFAEGDALVLGNEQYDVLVAVDDENCTLEDFQNALKTTEQQLAELQRQTEERLADVASLIFSAHLLILKDPGFSGAMEDMIKKGWSPARALTHVVNDYIHLFSSSKNLRLQEKVQDVKDLGHRLLQNLMGGDEEHGDYNNQVVIAEDLMPSDILKLMAQNVEGLIIVNGTVTSHIAILARSLEVPLVFTDDRRLLNLMDGTPLILDAVQGNIIIEPSDEIREGFKEILDGRKAAEKAENIKPETHTGDGVRVRILSNVNLLSDLKVALQMKSEGVGLYRSEFPFIVRSEFPSEEEQYHIYKTIVDDMDGREVVFRTLDIGGDKLLSYHQHGEETNPFLGLRAIRFSLKNLPVFNAQLRAMLRATSESTCKIMFPMISSLDEFYQARDVVNSCIAALREEGVPHNDKPILGVMVEIPAAVAIVDELAKETGFLCIGTNDLVQYILAVDRTNEHVATFYNAFHPAVLRALHRIVSTAVENNEEVSICGDVVLDPRIIPFLIGIGIRKVSVDPRYIHDVQKNIEKLNLPEAEKLAETLLKMGTLKEITKFLQEG